MNFEIVENDTFEICDLEYDVGGVGAEEASDSQVNHAAFVVAYKLPA